MSWFQHIVINYQSGKHPRLPSWDKSFFCSSSISDWDIAWILAWLSLWILMMSPELSGPTSPRPDTKHGLETVVGSGEWRGASRKRKGDRKTHISRHVPSQTCQMWGQSVQLTRVNRHQLAFIITRPKYFTYDLYPCWSQEEDSALWVHVSEQLQVHGVMACFPPLIFELQSDEQRCSSSHWLRAAAPVLKER